MKILLTSFLVALAAAEVAAGKPFFIEGQDPKPKGTTWEPVEELSDDFEGATLDESKWQANPAQNGWSWIGRPPGMFRKENVSVKDGEMRVTVGTLKEPVTIRRNEFRYQGAIVRSLHPGKLGWYFECRMKANATEMSSTFWLMTKRGTPNKLELDIQECVGRMSNKAGSWAKNWDQVFHSNCIHRTSRSNPTKKQWSRSTPTETKNHERFYVYAAWWESKEEVRFYLDGKYVYSIKPEVDWDIPAYIQMAIETYDWNPVPEDGGLVASGNLDQRTTRYDWVRVWKLRDMPEAQNE